MRPRFLLVVAGLTVTVPSCTEPVVQNYNSPTVDAAGADPSALQLLATGILSQLRATVTGEDLTTGILGREAFNYTLFPTNVSRANPRPGQFGLITAHDSTLPRTQPRVPLASARTRS